MKTIDINKSQVLNFNANAQLLDKKGQIRDLKIVEHTYHPETGQTTLVIYSSLFASDNYKLLVHENHIGLVIMEHVELSRPVYIHHYNWQNSSYHAYDRFYSASIVLPGEQYHLISHKFDSESNLLTIALGNSSFN